MKLYKILLTISSFTFTASLFAQNLSLKKVDGIVAINTEITELKHNGKAALKVKAIVSNKTAMVLIPGSDFENGSIEFEMAANRSPNSHPESRGFAGLAFHINKDTSAYDVIYLRATNGRAEDQIRRNHTVQYMALPDFDFGVLRKQFPEKYETYVDMVPDEWIKLKIEVKNRIVKLYVDEKEQPTLIVNDMLNKTLSGGIALWVGGSTDAYYRNLKLKKEN
jgi:hypothetical protein